MPYIFTAILVLSFLLFILGLINPKIAFFFNKEKANRKLVLILYGGLMVFSFVMLAITVPKNNSQQESIIEDDSKKVILDEQTILVLMEEFSVTPEVTDEELALVESNIVLFDSILSKNYSFLLNELAELAKKNVYFVPSNAWSKVDEDYSYLSAIFSHSRLQKLDFIKTKKLFTDATKIYNKIIEKYSFYGDTDSKQLLEEAIEHYLFETAPNTRGFKMLSIQPTKEVTEEGFICLAEYESFNEINVFKVENYYQLVVRFDIDSIKYRIIEEIEEPDFNIDLMDNYKP